LPTLGRMAGGVNSSQLPAFGRGDPDRLGPRKSADVFKHLDGTFNSGAFGFADTLGHSWAKSVQNAPSMYALPRKSVYGPGIVRQGMEPDARMLVRRSSIESHC
jgi:hypothetical protein